MYIKYFPFSATYYTILSDVVAAVAIASMSGSGNQVVLPDQYKFFFSLDSDYKDINLCFGFFSKVLYCFRKVRV